MSGPQAVPPRDAWRILADSIRPLPVDVVDLAVACGSWLAGPVVADRDLPPAPRAAMDGFALRAGDVSGSGRRLADRKSVV
jgi:molybdopterin biosynthesis enzyme